MTILDVELVMEAFRLMRSGRCKTAEELRTTFYEDFPDIEKERLDRALSTAAHKALEQMR